MTLFSNFSAFLLPLLFFSYWSIVGYGTLTLLYTQRFSLRNLLLSPAVGLAVTIVCIFTLSWFGLPVKAFAWVLCLSLLLMSAGILCYKRPFFPWRHYLPFVVILLASLFIVGRPLLEVGFSWLSHINDDMLNYSMSARYFIDHSYLSIPSDQNMINGRDYSSIYWFTMVPGTMRSGSELLLAWASDLLHVSPERIFMPLILGLHLTVIQAVAGLSYSSRKSQRIAFFSSLLYAVSSMANLGFFYQLIAQIDGLALLVTCTVFLLRKNIPRYSYALLRYGILCSILLSAFAIFYPELLALFFMAIAIYFGTLLIRKKFQAKLFFQLGSIIFLISVILLHGYLFNFITIVLSQIDHASLSIASKNSLFPYFLIPSGLANIWGIQALAGSMVEPWLSLSILLGLILFVITVFFAVYWLWKDQNSCSAVTITIILMLAHFFIKNGDFALFKLSMYAQPFFWSTLSAVIIQYFDRLKYAKHIKKIIIYSVFLILIGLNLVSTQIYLNRSRGIEYSDIPNAFKVDLGITLNTIFSASPSSIFLSDTPSIVMAKMQALHGINHTLLFPSRNFFMNIAGSVSYLKQPSNNYLYQYFSKFRPELLQSSNHLLSLFQSNYQSDCFSLFPENNPKKICNHFKTLIRPSQFTANTLLKISPEQSIFNRWKKKPFKHHLALMTVPLENVHNHLIFMDSTLGEHYYLPNNHSRISVYPQERDYFYPDNTFAAIKRYFLFNVLNPSQQTRIVLNITTTLNGNKINQLPHAIIIGEKRIPLNLTGNGSARVFSPVFSMQKINEQYFFMLDMQHDGQRFPGPNRRGLFSLYGRNIPIDARKIVAYGRDISIISDEDYKKIQAPALISEFPKNLDNPNLEYSGFYEDGWIGKNSYIYLSPKSQNTVFKMKGFLAKSESNQNSYSSMLTIWIDGKQILKQLLTQENFDIKLPVSLSLKRHIIKIHFSDRVPLPGADGRPASAKIELLGFE